MSRKRNETLPSFEVGDHVYCDILGIMPGTYAVVIERKQMKIPYSSWTEWKYTARVIFRDYHTKFNKEDFIRDDGLKVLSMSKKNGDEYISFLSIEQFVKDGLSLEDLGFVKA